MKTKYEELMNKSDESCLKAVAYAKKGESELARFWKNASNSYKQQARNLPINNA